MADLVNANFALIDQAVQRKQLVTGVPTGLRRTRRDDGRPAAVGLHHRRGPAVDGQDQPRAEHGPARRDEGRHDRRVLQPRNVEGAAVHEAADVRGRRIDAHRLRTGFLGERDFPKITAAMERLHAAKIFIDDTASIGVLEMRAKARRLTAEHGLDLIVVDYLQLMQGKGRFENRVLELASISRGMKALAKELNVPGRRAVAAEPRAGSQAGQAARSSPTCASRAPSNRTPTSSS